jgi:hypothetical protein
MDLIEQRYEKARRALAIKSATQSEATRRASNDHYAPRPSYTRRVPCAPVPQISGSCAPAIRGPRFHR